MKLFEFAIASIVDVNTGHGLVGKNLSVDYASAIHRGREIRVKSVLALFASIVDASTGHGLEGKNVSVDYTSAFRNAHEIRAKSLAAFFGSIKEQIGQVSQTTASGQITVVLSTRFQTAATGCSRTSESSVMN